MSYNDNLLQRHDFGPAVGVSLHGQTEYIADEGRDVISLDGSEGTYYQLDDASSLTGHNCNTIAFWFKPSNQIDYNSGPTDQIIMRLKDGSNPEHYERFLISFGRFQTADNGQVNNTLVAVRHLVRGVEGHSGVGSTYIPNQYKGISAINTYNDIDGTSSSSFSADTWYHFAISYNHQEDTPSPPYLGKYDFYINGILQAHFTDIGRHGNAPLLGNYSFDKAAFSYPFEECTGAEELIIGSDSSRGGFEGLVDDVRIYSTSLTGAEIQEVMLDYNIMSPDMLSRLRLLS